MWEADNGQAEIMNGTFDAIKNIIYQCNVSSCGSPTFPPPPVADGMTGIGMTLNRVSGDTIHVDYDVVMCNEDHAVMLYGTIEDFSGYTGAVSGCNLGATGSADFDISDSDVWFNLIWVNTDQDGGHPGFQSGGVSRTWNAAPFCGVIADDHSDNNCD